MYTDDIIIIGNSSDELQELLEIDIYSMGIVFLCELSQDKSQVLVINGDANERTKWSLGD